MTSGNNRSTSSYNEYWPDTTDQRPEGQPTTNFSLSHDPSYSLQSTYMTKHHIQNKGATSLDSWALSSDGSTYLNLSAALQNAQHYEAGNLIAQPYHAYSSNIPAPQDLLNSLFTQNEYPYSPAYSPYPITRDFQIVSRNKDVANDEQANFKIDQAIPKEGQSKDGDLLSAQAQSSDGSHDDSERPATPPISDIQNTEGYDGNATSLPDECDDDTVVDGWLSDEEDDDDDSLSDISSDNSNNSAGDLPPEAWTPFTEAWWDNPAIPSLSKHEMHYESLNQDFRYLRSRTHDLRFQDCPAYRRARVARGIRLTEARLHACEGSLSRVSRRMRDARVRLHRLRRRELGADVAELEEMMIRQTSLREVMSGEGAESPIVRVGKMSKMAKGRKRKGRKGRTRVEKGL